MSIADHVISSFGELKTYLIMFDKNVDGYWYEDCKIHAAGYNEFDAVFTFAQRNTGQNYFVSSVVLWSTI